MLPYDTLFWGGEKSCMKSYPLVQRNKYQMDSTVMQYDQQHRVGAQTKKNVCPGQGGFTHLHERDNTSHPRGIDDAQKKNQPPVLNNPPALFGVLPLIDHNCDMLPLSLDDLLNYTTLMLKFCTNKPIWASLLRQIFLGGGERGRFTQKKSYGFPRKKNLRKLNTYCKLL
jgi:hypothetical protein